MSFVLSSISGNLISAASAGFAPTNSADVSAIASAYQVVSSTATELYAGTAYLTSVNDAPVSASRAGQAANASMANSAYYDGTGRLISSLPDSAAVSSIASSYAESAASGKLDTTAFNSGDFYGTGNISGFVGSAYVDSAVSGKMDSSAMTSYALSSDVSGVIDTVSANSATWGQDSQVVTSTSSAEGVYYDDSGNLSSYTAINALNGSALSAIASLSAEKAVVAKNASHATSADLASFDENYRALTAMALSSDVSGVIDTVSSNSASWAQAGVDSATVSAIASAYVESGVSGKLDSTAFNSSDFYGTGNASGFVDSGYVDSAVSGKLDATAQVVTATAGDGTYVTAINGMGISGQGGGGGGIDSATCSSIASAYAESAASSKLDSTAFNSGDFYTTANESGYVGSSYVESAVSGKLDITAFNSAAFYGTGNDSGFVDSGYVESQVSGKQDSSSMSAYALSSDVSGVIDTVSANSASWGGGATGDYVEKSAMEVAIGSGNDVFLSAFAQGADNSANRASVAFGVSNAAAGSSIAVGNSCSASTKSLAVGKSCTAWSNALAIGSTAYANNRGLAVGDRCSAAGNSLAVGYICNAGSNSFAQGNWVTATSTAAAFGIYNLHGDGHTGSGDSAAFTIGDGTANTARHDLMLVTKDGEITMFSSTADTVGTGIMSSIRGLSATLGDVSTALAAL